MADEMLCIGHDNEILSFGGQIDDELGKCCWCTEMITKSFVRNLRRLSWLYMVVPLLIERSESRGHVVGTISLSSQG
jgi:hypothetical protein